MPHHLERHGGQAPTVALVTYAGVPDLTPDDRLLADSLGRVGIHSVPAVWDDRTVDWTAFAALVLRSCWDYHRRLDEFLGWVSRVERAGVPLVNSPGLIRWNTRKQYLTSLADRGVAVVPTTWIPPHPKPSLRELLDERQWDEAVIKPAVSASAHNTWRVSRATLAEAQLRLEQAGGEGWMMLQPYIEEIERDGEWSLLFLAGEFSHAVIKRPRPGDFRVQSELGGSYARAEPPPALIADASRALSAAPGRTLYARVDGCAVEGRLLLMELELVEPVLFLGEAPGSAARLARGVADLLALTRPGERA